MDRRDFFGAGLAAAALSLIARPTKTDPTDPIQVRHERRGDLYIVHYDVHLILEVGAC